MAGNIPSLSEEWAASIVAQVLDAKVTLTDGVEATPDSLDALIEYSDGRSGAMEVVRLASQDALKLRAELRRISHKRPNPGSGKWLVYVGKHSHLKRLLECYEIVILTCEEHSVRRVCELPSHVLARDPALQWLAQERRTTMFCVTPVGAVETSRSVDFLEPLDREVFGAQGDLVDDLNASFRENRVIAKHIAKLAKSELDERHLFIQVDATGLSDKGFVDLFLGISHPGRPLELDARISHVWLLVDPVDQVTLWTRGVGWRYGEFDLGLEDYD